MRRAAWPRAGRPQRRPAFTTRVNGKHGQPNGRTVIALDGVEFVEFVRRSLQHLAPSGFKRIRHCGLLASTATTQRLAAARQLLGMPAAKPGAAEAVADFLRRAAAIDIGVLSAFGQPHGLQLELQRVLRIAALVVLFAHLSWSITVTSSSAMNDLF